MNALTLLADAAEMTPVRLITEYLIYAAVIVVGILILLLLRRKTRLPRHAELRRQLADYARALEDFCPTAESGSLTRMKFFKAVSKLVYRADKFIYVTDRMADKERDGEIGSVSVLLGQARTELSSYKFGTRGTEDADGIRAALSKVQESVALFDRILARDAQLKGERAKKSVKRETRRLPVIPTEDDDGSP